MYAHDVVLPGMLVGGILRSPHPHARIRRLDTGSALKLPGVHAIVSASDVPTGRMYLHEGGDRSDRTPFAVDVVRFIGQEVAAVAAEDESATRLALRAIEVKYRRLPAALTVEQALVRGAPTLHKRPTGTNVSFAAGFDWGDVDGAMQEAAYVSTGAYRYPQITHASMEPHTTIAWWREESDLLEIWSSTQSPYHLRKELAHVLDLRFDQIDFHPVSVGGGFGAKSKITDHEVITALLSMRSGRPVKIAYSREEEFATTKTRHEFRTKLTAAMTADGRLTAFETEAIADNGAFNHSGPSVLLAGIGTVGLMYQPQGVRGRGRLVDTAKVPGGQFRGYGMPQVSLALESEIDELARSAGMDPIDLRIRNVRVAGEETLSGARPHSVALVECLQAAREAIGWDDKRAHRRPGRGVGVAVAIHGSGTYSWPGSNTSSVRLAIDPSGRIVVSFGGADPGTGQRTVLAQIVAETLGVEAEDVAVEMMDMSTKSPDQGSFSSRGTHFGGNAAAAAAQATADLLLEAAREKLGTQDVKLQGGEARSDADAVAIGDLVAVMAASTDGVLVCETEFEDSSVVPTSSLPANDGRGNTSPTYSYAAHIAEVEVDTRTGLVKVVDYVAVHDAGTLINPAQAESQVVGGVVMGLGATLREELRFDHGRMVNPAYIHYGVPRAADVPPIRVQFVGGPDPLGPYGGKSVGEIAMVPVAAAVANAVRDASGLRMRELPITPDKVVAEAHRLGLEQRVQIVPVWRRPHLWWIGFMRWAYPRGVAWVLDRIGRRLIRRRQVPAVTDILGPETVEDLLQHVSDGFVPMGAGTDVYVLRRQELSFATRLVSTSTVRELTTIEHTEGFLRVGGGVTLADLAHATRAELPAVAEAIDTIATPQIRAVATVAGNLLQEKRCWFFRNGFECYKRSGPTAPCYAVLGDHRFYHASIDGHRCQAVTPSDLATVLVALDATVDVARSGSARTIRAEELYTGPGESCLDRDEVLVAVRIPSSAANKAAVFGKLRLWEGDFALTSVAIAADATGGSWQDVRLCLGGMAPTPWLARHAARELQATAASAESLARALSTDLSTHAHPLPGNAWKLSATVALARDTAERMLSGPESVRSDR